MIAKTDQQMQKAAIFARVRTEASILRMYWLNDVWPQIEKEIDRRLNTGESIELNVPEIDALGRAYIENFFKQNANQIESGD